MRPLTRMVAARNETQDWFGGRCPLIRCFTTVDAVVYQAVVAWSPSKDCGVAVRPDDWLRRFHDGDRSIIEQIYREHFTSVSRAVALLSSAADRETAIHEIFLRLLTRPALRGAFLGGDFGAWLGVVAHNHAIDCARQRRREVPADCAAHPLVDGSATHVEARIMVERFRAEVLPPKWRGVFDTRFIQQLTQEEAATALGVGRTTLAYQESRVRRLLRRFFLR
jgi:RNA polymerase sigma-70 factor (ECF subfamily)